LEAETTTVSGIIIPDSAQKDESTVGLIMAVGEGNISPKGDKEKMVVKVGDKVMYKKWGGNEVKVGDEEWKIVEQKDILAILS
jgi:chaperonin GroES